MYKKSKNIISIFSLSFFVLVANSASAGVMTRSDFLQGAMPKLMNRLCFDEASPFKNLYKGDPKTCTIEMLEIYVQSCERFVPAQFDFDRQFRAVYSMTIQCLSAYYLGGEQQASFELKMRGEPLRKDIWLKRTKPPLVAYLCNPNAVFKKGMFKGDQGECVEFAQKQFDTCAYDLGYVKIPDPLQSRQVGNKYGSIMTECISAHYVGGDILKAFKLFQEHENKPK